MLSFLFLSTLSTLEPDSYPRRKSLQDHSDTRIPKGKPVFDEYFEKVMKKKEIEQYPNTMLDGSGKRVCKPGYLTSNIEKGCWKCEPVCKDYEICSQSLNCIPIVPSLISVVHKKELNVEFALGPHKIKPNRVFCKVGDVVSTGIIRNNYTVKCPYVQSSDTVSLSFDNVTWSDSAHFEPRVPISTERIYTYAGAAGILVGLVLLPVFCRKSDKKRVFRKVMEPGDAPLAFFPVVAEQNE